MSGIMDFLFGSKGKIDWKELQKMVELQAETNRTDRMGAFTGWSWDEDKKVQTQTINPAFQGAVERLGFNAGKPQDPYTSPSQFSQMLDAKMANQMDRQGLDTGYAQTNVPWKPSAYRPGRTAQAFLPPAPGEGPAPPVTDPGAGGGLPPGYQGGAQPGAGAGGSNKQNQRPEIADDGGYI